MITFEEFKQELQEALSHLHDPDYVASERLCAAIGCDLQDGLPSVQSTILHAIERLKPPPDTPSSALTKQVYDLLHNRFVLELTQEETAYRIDVSRRTVSRMQHRAVHALAGTLWEHGQPTKGAAADIQSLDWRSQVQRELDSLQAKTPDALTDVEEALGNVLGFMGPLAAKLGTRIEVKSVQPGLVAAVHPVLLQQVLISAVKRLAPHISDGQIAIYARLEDGNAKITLTGAAAVENGLSETDLTSDIPLSRDMSIEACVDGSQAFVWVSAPSVSKVTVLAVDDNEDMARFYRDCTIGTRYHIVHAAQGSGLIEVVEATTPDVIVLDVMLPDVDGWRLLMRLRENPKTRSIPVIVCSVVREEDLALSLGAAGYLTKPVRPRQFVQALDQVVPPAATADSTSPANNAKEC
jgi:CheY-like chemotaxis protein